MTNKPLWDHQRRDIETCVLSPLGVMNTSDPGTGKTRVCIEAIRHLPPGVKTLILAPKSILQCAWGNDIEEYAPDLTYSIATATNRAAAFAKDVDIVITNHDAAKWLAKEGAKYVHLFEDGLLIIDESTAFKNPTSLRSKAAAAIRPVFKKCFCMSGTPTPQGIIDIWHQIYLVDGGERLGNSFYRFRAQTYTPVNKGNFTTWTEKEGVADAIADIISDITIRNKRDDCMDLPPNQLIWRRITLSPAHQKKYEELKRRSILELHDGDISAVNAAVLLNKLLQLVSGAVYDDQGTPHLVDSDRYELIMDLVAERDHTVVFFNWRHQRDQLIKLAKAADLSYGIIDGSVSGRDRTNYVSDFQAGNIRVLFCHVQSASHGITLTRAATTIFASAFHNAEHFEQARARIFRGGQTRSTQTILISADNTIEPKVYKSLTEKVSKMDDLLEMLRS